MATIQNHLLTSNQLSLSYYRLGEGKRCLFAFNGFGKTAEELAHLLSETSLPQYFTIYCFDFFFHGKSNYPQSRVEKNTITKKEYAQLFKSFMNDEGISKFSLYGYSLGGKLALSLLEQLPEYIDKIFLSAPDGMKKIWWYQSVANFAPFKWIYKYYIKNPKWCFWWFDVLKSVKLLHPKAVHFAKTQMATAENRLKIFNVWMVLRNFEPNYDLLKNVGRKNHINIFVGRYDRVIPAKNAETFINRVNFQHAEIEIIDAGHLLQDPETLKRITEHIIEKL